MIDHKSNRVSADFRFAAAVAMFGQLLRDSEFKGNATYDKVMKKDTRENSYGLQKLPEVSEIVEVFHGIHTPKSRFPQFGL